MLENPDKKWTDDELPPISQPWTASDISKKVNMLQKLAVQLRAKRFENGSLRLDQACVSFKDSKILTE